MSSDLALFASQVVPKIVPSLVLDCMTDAPSWLAPAKVARLHTIFAQFSRAGLANPRGLIGHHD